MRFSLLYYWPISDEFGLWSLKGHCGLYFLCSKRTQTRSSCIGLANNFIPIFPLNLMKSPNKLFGQLNTISAVVSLFSNTSSLMLILFKNERSFRNTDNCYQGYFSQHLPLHICDGHITCTWGNKSLHPLITSQVLTPAVGSDLNIQVREHCLSGACST